MRPRRLITRILSALIVIALLGGYLFLLTQRDRWVSRKGVPRDFGDIEFFTLAETAIPSSLHALRSNEVTREQTDETLSFIWEEWKQDWRRAETIGRIPPRYRSDSNQVVTLPNGGTISVGWVSMGYDPNLGDFPVREPFTPTKATVRGDTWEVLNEDAFRKFREEELNLPSSLKSFAVGGRKPSDSIEFTP